MYLVVDLFILSSGGMQANHLTITRSRSHCTANLSDIIRNRAGWGESFVHVLFSFDFKYFYFFSFTCVPEGRFMLCYQ